MLYNLNWQVVVDPDFEEAANYVEEHGWCQERSIDSDGRVCIRGAFDMSPAISNRWLAIHRLTRKLNSPEAYNDAPGRTKEEVVATLRRLARGGCIALALIVALLLVPCDYAMSADLPEGCSYGIGTNCPCQPGYHWVVTDQACETDK